MWTVADLSAGQVEPLVSILGDEFYADAEMMRQAIPISSSFNLIHLATMFKVDISVVKDRPFDRQRLACRQARPLELSALRPVRSCCYTEISLKSAVRRYRIIRVHS